MSQSILTNASVASIGRVVNVGLGIIVTGLLTRFFGEAAFGHYTLVLTYGTLVQLAADFGLYLTLTREIGHSEAESAIVSHIVSLRLLLVVMAFGLGWLATLYISSLQPVSAVFGIATLGLICQSISQLLMGVYQKHGTVWRATVADIVGRVTQIVAVLVSAPLLHTVTAMISAFTLSSLTALFLHLMLLPTQLRVRLTAPHQQWTGLLKASWPLGAMLVLNAIYFRIDTVILSFFRGAAEIGHYGLAYRIMESGLFFPAMFGGLLLPRLSYLWHRGDRQQTSRLLAESVRLASVVGAFCWLVLLLLARPLIVLIAGEDFAPAAPLLQILSGSLASMFLGNLFGYALVATGRQKVLLYLYAVLAVANTIISLMVIPQGGAHAAAITTLVTELAATITAAVVVARLVGLRLAWQFSFKLLLSVVITAGVVIVLREHINVISLLIIATSFYGALCWLTGTITKRHVRLLLASPA